MNKLINEHLCEIEQYMLKNAGDAAHDADHIYRVLNQALKIAKNYDKDECIIVNLSGRGDKDIETIINYK